jgi:hypothetical protein
LKLWLLDADVIIDLLTFNLFENLVKKHEVYVASSVINEVKYFNEGKEKINFRVEYIESGKVFEKEASVNDIDVARNKMPPRLKDAIHYGELESLTIMQQEKSLIICTCDHIAIRALPFLDLSERGISLEKLLKQTGLSNAKLEDRHTEKYFQNNLNEGKKDWIQRSNTNTAL